jgi:hypothetical protein
MEEIFFQSKKLMKKIFLASPDRSGILFLASLAGKRFSGWQERMVLKKLMFLLLKKLTIRECAD